MGQEELPLCGGVLVGGDGLAQDARHDAPEAVARVAVVEVVGAAQHGGEAAQNQHAAALVKDRLEPWGMCWYPVMRLIIGAATKERP